MISDPPHQKQWDRQFGRPHTLQPLQANLGDTRCNRRRRRRVIAAVPRAVACVSGRPVRHAERNASTAAPTRRRSFPIRTAIRRAPGADSRDHRCHVQRYPRRSWHRRDPARWGRHAVPPGSKGQRPRLPALRTPTFPCDAVKVERPHHLPSMVVLLRPHWATSR